MVSSRPTSGGPTQKDYAFDRIWQGGFLFAIGALSTIGMRVFLGYVMGLTVIATVVGFGWLASGLIGYWNANR